MFLWDKACCFQACPTWLNVKNWKQEEQRLIDSLCCPEKNGLMMFVPEWSCPHLIFFLQPLEPSPKHLNRLSDIREPGKVSGLMMILPC